MREEQTDWFVKVVIPVWGPSHCHIRASLGRQRLGLGAYGNSWRCAPNVGNAPSDKNSLAEFVRSAFVFGKEKKTKHSHAALGCGMADGGVCWSWDNSATLGLTVMTTF